MSAANQGRIGRRAVLALLPALGLPGCAVTQVRTPVREFQGQRPVSAAYVYSFMDLRERELGSKFLDQLRRQLGDALASHDVRSTQLSFSESPVRSEYAMGPDPARGFSWGLLAGRPRESSSTRVPVREVVAANLAAESNFGASHRLIVFPAMLTQTGVGANFDVRWDLIDVVTGRLDWFSLTSTRHMNLIYKDENPESRAKALVDNVTAEMLKAGVLRTRPVI
jgi:hypothetical protein